MEEVMHCYFLPHDRGKSMTILLMSRKARRPIKYYQKGRMSLFPIRHLFHHGKILHRKADFARIPAFQLNIFRGVDQIKPALLTRAKLTWCSP